MQVIVDKLKLNNAAQQRLSQPVHSAIIWAHCRGGLRRECHACNMLTTPRRREDHHTQQRDRVSVSMSHYSQLDDQFWWNSFSSKLQKPEEIGPTVLYKVRGNAEGLQAESSCVVSDLCWMVDTVPHFVYLTAASCLANIARLYSIVHTKWSLCPWWYLSSCWSHCRTHNILARGDVLALRPATCLTQQISIVWTTR